MAEIVLTADRTIMSDFHGKMVFGFASCAPENPIPGPILQWLFFPKGKNRNGIVEEAPLGLRRIEAKLLNAGFDAKIVDPDHLKECLTTLILSEQRLTKTVIRQFKGELSYRTVKSGFFVGNHDNFLYYAFPSPEELESTHYSWWRSALTQCF